MNNELIPKNDEVVIICHKCGRAWIEKMFNQKVMFNPPICGSCRVKETKQQFDNYKN